MLLHFLAFWNWCNFSSVKKILFFRYAAIVFPASYLHHKTLHNENLYYTTNANVSGFSNTGAAIKKIKAKGRAGGQ
jgi:hypothetical protein